MSDHTIYENPLITRYASRDMAQLWSAQKKHSTWRRLWLALAESQMELALLSENGAQPRITPNQIQQLREHLDDIDFDRVAVLEREVRHDVMAHVKAYGELCPDAADIIHLGATSCFVTDNTDLLLIRESLTQIQNKLANVIDTLATFAEKHKAITTLGYTHYQPAQLTTVGKRACLWLQDLVLDLEEHEHRQAALCFRGVKGTTGTQASFLSLFKDEEKVKQLDTMLARKMGFDRLFLITGQTYTRKIDSQVLDALSGIGQSLHKMGSDLRLLSHDREVDEKQEKGQIGSSAMAYKRNPMRAERMCGLARFLLSLPANAAQTAATQWLERTLDDSANRRLSLPQGFLAADAILNLALNISGSLTVNEAVVQQNVEHVFPYMATENILMAAVAQGGNRQELHEVIRQHSHAVTQALKEGQEKNDLIERLQNDSHFAGVDFSSLLSHSAFTGRAKQQVEAFIQQQINPIREKYNAVLGQQAELHV